MNSLLKSPQDIQSGLNPSYVTFRHHDSSRFYGDTRQGYGPFDPSSRVNVNSNSTLQSMLISDNVKKFAVRKWNLFYTVDNIIEGYNDTLQFGYRQQSPPLLTTLGPITITPGFYQIEQLGTEIVSKLQIWLNNHFGVPVPNASFIFENNESDVDGLLGQLKLMVGGTSNSLSIDPQCSFVSNRGDMFSLTSYNSYPNPINDPESYLVLSFNNINHCSYIDVVCSGDLTADIKLPSGNNIITNSNTIYRLNNIKRGLNIYDEEGELSWININRPIYNFTLRFLDSKGDEIRGARTRDFYSWFEFAVQ